MYCSNCGNQMEAGVAFCSECGMAVEADATLASESLPVPEGPEVEGSAPVAWTPIAPPPEAAPPVAHMPHMPYVPPKKSGLPKHMLPIIIGGAAFVIVVIAILIAVFSSGGRSNIIGTWEEATANAWRQRMVFNRDGSGLSFEVNADTGLTEDEVDFRWASSNDFPDLLRIEIADPDNPDDTYVIWMEFSINVNAIGEEILNIRELGGWGNWEHFRRIQ